MDPIRGDGVLLRLLEPPDRERWLELLHDPEQLRFGTPAVVPVPETLEDLDERLQAAERALGDGVPGTFAVASEEEPGRLLGIDRLGLPRPAPATGRGRGLRHPPRLSAAARC